MSSAPSVDLNPFTEQTAGKYFVGREEQLLSFKRTLTGLKLGQPRHLFVAGTHGTGKTSYLYKLVELSRAEDFLAALPTLDPAATGRQHIATVVQSLISTLDACLSVDPLQQSRTLTRDWEKGGESTKFRLARTERLLNDDLRADLETIQRLASEAGRKRIVVCIDEGQRIDAFALSALKNALQHLDSYLVVLSLRLIDDANGIVAGGRAILDTKANEAEGDLGASRFFLAGVPLGPFETDQESRSCLMKRLEGNAVRFDDDVMSLAGRVTARHPAKLIALASNLYDLAAVTPTRTADMGAFRKSFIDHYRTEYCEAVQLAGSLPETSRSVIMALLDFDRAVRPTELALHLAPKIDGSALEIVTAGVESELHQLEGSSFLSAAEDGYRLSDPVRRFALGAVLGKS
ncbi:ATP-binding protein [Couchioplanes azureus]|uniref:ATP-binding protein n=1 Tax=Couchioplanes caeruleus TaxID=56438 RepID=UPI001670B849|nr:ATP-binding protein [Couchioplanes caeruleus]GGQ61367.1 hypothetical protein GCM10010166_33840 [Couchioplanes caeruleus subsp. azureus]